MTFIKGQSGNPGGRPKDPLAKELFLNHLDQAIENLQKALDDPDPNVYLKASCIVFERIWGKAAQAVEHSGKVTGLVLEIVSQNDNKSEPDPAIPS